MCAYRLAPSVHLRVSEDGAVFLNLLRDEFFGLDTQQTRALSSLLAHPDDSCHSDNALTELAQTLCSSGLLESTDSAASPAQGLPAATGAVSGFPIPSARCELLPWERMGAPSIRPHHVLAFVKAWRRAAHFVQPGRLARAVDRARLRKRSTTEEDFHVPTARRLLSAFYHMRAFAYGKRAQCLLDSLVLLEFLAMYGVHPTWIIGVKIRPFASHSWLQYRHYVLNGTAAYVRAYLPIIAV